MPVLFHEDREEKRAEERLARRIARRPSDRLDALERDVGSILLTVNAIMEKLMALDPNVQKILDDSAALATSVAGLTSQLTDTKNQLSTALANLSAGQPIDAADLAALQQAAASLDNTLAAASAAAPAVASTAAAASAAGASSVTPASAAAHHALG